ncbi:MAG: molybdopterin-dependent oxidoreductase [Syntrophobacteraceae bacterium]|nr:molybdopterin-dependent oxidoreductase [Syntrophobacteraceae bacterium]
MNKASGVTIGAVPDGGALQNSRVPLTATGIEIRKTICSICNPLSHCGIDAHVKEGVVIKVEGSRNPHNDGTLCSKGAAGRQYIYHKDRLKTPLARTGEKGSGQFRPISWEEALDIAAQRLNGIKVESGAESVAFFAGYSKWMRPFLKRLAHSFGSPNYCTESSTCSSAAVLAAKLNYGCLAGPDTANARCLLVWSANPFYSNTSMVRRLLDAKDRGLKIIEVGPLLTPLTRHADVHLRIRPGTSGALALCMANVIIEEGLYDRDFVEKWTVGFDDFQEYATNFSPKRTEAITGVPANLIEEAARLYAGTGPAALLTSASPTVHHTNGVQNHRALTALIGLTGNFDVQGGNLVRPPGYLYVPGPPTTREHEYEQSRPWSEMAPRIGVERFPVWSRVVPEAQAMELPFRIGTGSPYPVRSVVGFGLNHRMWPGCGLLYERLKKLDFFLQVELFMTDTCKAADLILPACTSFERSELKFYPEKFVLWTTPVIPPLGDSRPDTEIIFDLANRIAARDGLLKQGYEANVDWILKPAGLTVEELKQHPGGLALKDIEQVPFRKYEKSGFQTPSGKMEFASTVLSSFGLDPLPTYKEPELSPVSRPELSTDFPLVLTTGARLPMFIHSRTFRLPWTNGLWPEPMLDINPGDSAVRAIAQGDLVLLSTPANSIRVKANITNIVPRGVINIYHGYRDPEINTLFEPDYLDPISGFPGFKSLLCQVEKSIKKED